MIKRVALVYYVELADLPVSRDGREAQKQGLIDAARGAIEHGLHELSDPTREQVEADCWTDLAPFGADDDDEAPTMGARLQ